MNEDVSVVFSTALIQVEDKIKVDNDTIKEIYDISNIMKRSL